MPLTDKAVLAAVSIHALAGRATGPFLRAIYAYQGTKVVQMLVKLLPYVFVGVCV